MQKRAEAKGKDVIPTQGRVIAKGSSTAGRGTAVSRGRGVVVPPAKAGKDIRPTFVILSKYILSHVLFFSIEIISKF